MSQPNVSFQTANHICLTQRKKSIWTKWLIYCRTLVHTHVQEFLSNTNFSVYALCLDHAYQPGDLYDRSSSFFSSAVDRIWHSQAFNVGTAGAKIFSGPAVEEFGYEVQQATNHEGKWYEWTLFLHLIYYADSTGLYPHCHWVSSHMSSLS